MIIFENVTLQRNDFTILENISFEMKKNEHWAIIGPNGSGKSTLLDAISGKLFPRNGKIQKPNYKDIEVVPRDYSFHRIVGGAYQYYQQRFNTYDAAIAPTLWEILQNQVKPIGTVDAKSVELPPLAYSETHLNEISQMLHIEHLLHRPIVTLSNGETRRSLIAHSLLKSPQVLLLDNPFTGLDVNSRVLLHNILNTIAQKGNTQLIIVCASKEIPSAITKVLFLENKQIKATFERPFLLDEHLFNYPKFDEKLLHKLKESATFSDFSTAVAFRNATVQYNGQRVVNRVNWVVKKGEKWALMGANGSGKSTLLSLIVGDNPQAYQNDFDLFDKKRGTGESIWEIKRRIGYVSPELHLYFNRQLTVWKAVASGLFDSAGLFKTLTEAQYQTVFDYIDLIGIREIADRRLSELSSGEQRLVFLARALVKNPPLLILDEPCQGLDFNHIVYFRELVDTLVKALDKTLIYVTHYEEEIPACVSKKIILQNGEKIL